jgi:hypothetical protein
MNKKYSLSDEQKKKYALKAKEKYLNLSEEDREFKKKRDKDYRLRNKEKLNQKRKAYLNLKMQDPEFRRKRKESKKLAKKKKKEKDPISFLGEHIKDSARNRGIDAPHAPIEYRDWYIKHKKICYFCGNNDQEIRNYLRLEGEKITVNQNRLQIERIDSSKGYLLNNLTLACSICNTHKSDIISAEDFKEIAIKYIAPKIKKKLQQV